MYVQSYEILLVNGPYGFSGACNQAVMNAT